MSYSSQVKLPATTLSAALFTPPLLTTTPHTPSADVGALTRLSLRAEDGSGRPAAWHLAHVEACNLKMGERALFVCRDWVRGSGVELAASGDAGALEDVEYEVRDVRAVRAAYAVLRSVGAHVWWP